MRHKVSRDKNTCMRKINTYPPRQKLFFWLVKTKKIRYGKEIRNVGILEAEIYHYWLSVLTWKTKDSATLVPETPNDAISSLKSGKGAR